MGKVLGKGNYRVVIRFFTKKDKIRNYDTKQRKEFACKTLKSAFHKIRTIQRNYGQNLDEFMLFDFNTHKLRWYYSQGA